MTRHMNVGEKNGEWKGDDVSYKALHQWVCRHKQKNGVCGSCGKKSRTDFHNISGEYKRDVNDYEELCRSCHNKKDENNRKPIDNDVIKHLYFDEKKSTVEIAKMFGVTARMIGLRIKEMGLESRHFVSISDDVIRTLYIEKKMSTLKIASFLKVGKSQIGNKIKRMGISRSVSEARRVKDENNEIYPQSEN